MLPSNRPGDSQSMLPLFPAEALKEARWAGLPFRYVGGLHLPTLNLWLDPPVQRELAVVTHGHTDHCRARHGVAIATPVTAALYRRRFAGTRAGARLDVVELPFSRPLDLDDHRIELFPSGHVLGAAQVQVTLPSGRRLVYTGDLQLRASRCAEPAEVRACDDLVIECTFGEPRYRFPDNAEVEAALARLLDEWLGRGFLPVVAAYALGKAQEAVHLLQELGFAVTAERPIISYADVYRCHGCALGPIVAWPVKSPDMMDLMGGRGAVLVLSPQRARQLRRLGRASLAGEPPRPVRVVLLSGWALHPGTAARSGVDAALPLSDHADFPALLRYVEQAAPQRVFTVHGRPTFAAYLRRRGVHAVHLDHRGLLT
jgi:putative mRNA 3-end processing factor